MISRDLFSLSPGSFIPTVVEDLSPAAIADNIVHHEESHLCCAILLFLVSFLLKRSPSLPGSSSAQLDYRILCINKCLEQTLVAPWLLDMAKPALVLASAWVTRTTCSFISV